MMAERSAQKAFTLLELVVVLAIISTIAAIAAPRYANALTNYRADGAARRIAADLELARTRARSISADVTVTFEIAGNRYRIPGMPGLDNAAVEMRVDLSVEPYRAKLVAANFSGAAQVVFDGYGIPDSGGTVTVTCGSAKRIVFLDRETGRAGIQ